jgi:hypothetical protein
MKINIAQVLKREAEKKLEVKPLPKVVVIAPRSAPITRSTIAQKILTETPPEMRQKVREYGDNVAKESILKGLWEEISTLKTARGKLATRTAYLVTEVAQKLMKESEATAQSFMSGDLPMPEIQEHYAKIQALTDQATAVWDRIQYVEQYGKLPVAPEAPVAVLEEESPEASSLHHHIRRLDDRIHKTKKKLAGRVPKNPSRLATWKEKLAMDEIQRDELKRKLKNLQYGARAERTGGA